MHRTPTKIVALLAVLTATSACEKDDGNRARAGERADEPTAAGAEQPANTKRPTELSAKAIGNAAGTKAKKTDDGIVRIGWLRDKVEVAVDGAQLPPAAGLGSWAGFQALPSGDAMVMGDTVVFQDEIDAAIDAAFAGGLDVTALHNHFTFDDPPVYFMHIGGSGDPEELASAVKGMWDAIKAVREKTPEPASSFPGGAPRKPGPLDKKAIAEAIGHPAADKPGGVVKVVVPREASMHGQSFDSEMGLATWAAFAGSDASASIDGDFAMTAAEVQPVLRALREHDLHVVALHNHMIDETPAYYFVHYWGKGKALDLAQGFRAALDARKDAQP